MIAVIDYGAGNLHSVQKAIEHVGGQATIISDPATILAAEKVILPGVGAFKDGMDGLTAGGLVPTIKQVAASKVPFLGICLGMQLLFEESEEQGHHQGLGLLPGRVVAFCEPGLRIPQIGWNQLETTRESPLFLDIPPSSYAYFNHSYFCVPKDEQQIIARTHYGKAFASAVWDGNIFGVQFHPEKSQRVGLQILKNFVELSHA